MNKPNGDVSVMGAGGSVHIIETASIGKTIVVEERGIGVDSISPNGSMAAGRLHQSESIELVLGKQSSSEVQRDTESALRKRRRGVGRDEGMKEGGGVRVGGR